MNSSGYMLCEQFDHILSPDESQSLQPQLLKSCFPHAGVSVA